MSEKRAPVDVVDDPRSRDRKMLRWLLGGSVVILGSLYVAGYVFASERLPRSTTIEGVDVGGLHVKDAEAALEKGLQDRLDDPIRLVVEDQQAPIDPTKAGLSVDFAASVAQVPVGRSWAPTAIWETLTGGSDREAVVVADATKLGRELDRFAEIVDVPAVEGDITFTRTKAIATYPETGSSLDAAAAADLLQANYPSDGSAVEAEMVVKASAITGGEVSRALKEVANPAMSAPVTYVIGGEPVVLRPAKYARALSMEPADGELVLEVDSKRLRAALDPAMITIAEEPVDATVAIVGGSPTVVPAKKGVSIDYDRIVEAFPELVVGAGADRKLSMPTQAQSPDFSTADAAALGINEKISEFTTYYPHEDYRNVNIGRAAQLIDGTILKPDETFSLNGAVGERTAANGFTEGFIISDGVFRKELGGGVSQVATTTFNAAFFAGLKDVEHKPHSFYISRYPVGREATVAWPSVDLKFANDTGHGVLIQTVHTPSTPSTQGALTVRMWGTKKWDVTALTGSRYATTAPSTRYLTGPGCVPNVGYSGFQIDVTRVFRLPGKAKVDHQEVLHTTYTPSDSVVCR